MEAYHNIEKGMVKSVCAKCQYAPAARDSDGYTWRCQRSREVINYVTGVTFMVLDKCTDKNSNGQCQDFVKRKES